MKEIAEFCTNKKCVKPIFKGDRVHNHGPDLYCSLPCALEELTKKK